MMLVIVNVLDICRGDSSPLHIFKKIDYVYIYIYLTKTAKTPLLYNYFSK